MNKILFSFGNQRYYASLDALEHSVKNFGKIDQFIKFKDTDIDPNFYQSYAQHFKDGRGFGYWIWKAYFINKLLESASDEDIFIYADAGNLVCNELTPLYNLCQSDSKGIILFENTDGELTGNVWKNNLWTKSDCFNLMGLKTPEYLYGDQVNAAFMVFRKTLFSVNFFSIFFKYCQNYNIISDAPNITDNFNIDFRDHRHDQSILSLLSIKYKVSIHRDPSQWGNHRISPRSPYQQLFFHHRRKYLS